MDPKRLLEPHLVIRQVLLPPTGEWISSLPGWVFVHVTGQAYSLHARKNETLENGSVVALPRLARSCIRASQLGKVVLHYFQVEIERLTGLVGLGEHQALQGIQDDAEPQVLAPNHPAAEKFKKLCLNLKANDFSLRLQLLDIFTEILGRELKNSPSELARDNSAKARIADLVKQMPAGELLNLEFDNLVEQMSCSPRHVSRIFNEVVGMSFREKKNQVRLLHACELLSTTECNILDIALESGYQSISLFHLMFKKHFGVTPGKWRETARTRQSVRHRAPRREMLRA